MLPFVMWRKNWSFADDLTFKHLVCDWKVLCLTKIKKWIFMLTLLLEKEKVKRKKDMARWISGLVAHHGSKIRKVMPYVSYYIPEIIFNPTSYLTTHLITPLKTDICNWTVYFLVLWHFFLLGFKQ